MKNTKAELQKIRKNIDHIDGQLVRLLNERAKNVLKVKNIKTQGKMHFYARTAKGKFIKGLEG